MDKILSRLKEQVEQDKKNLIVYRNEKSRDVIKLIELFSNVDLIINSNRDEILEFISMVLSSIFDKETYNIYMGNIIDLIDKYRKFVDISYIKEKYDDFLKNLCELLEKEKIKIEQKAEEEHDFKFGNNDYEIIINKIENNQVLTLKDTDLIIKLYGNNYKELCEILTQIDNYNILCESKEKNDKYNSVKDLFDKNYKDEAGNLIIDEDGNSVYDRLPNKFKESLDRQYFKDPKTFRQVFDIIFMNDEFKFIRSYGTSFNDSDVLYKEQKELCKILRNADYNLLNNNLGKLCKKYGLSMQSLFENIPGVYKRVSKSKHSHSDGSRNVEKDELIIKGCYDHFEKNMKYLEEIDAKLPNIFMSQEKYYRLLSIKHEQFKRNIECASTILGLTIDEIIAYASEIITPSLFADNVALLEEYGLDSGADKGVLINILGIQNLKSHIGAFIESGTFDYLNGSTSNSSKAFTGRLVRGLDHMKKLYYGNSTKVNGLVEMEQDPSKLVITSRGVKGSFDYYSPKLMTKHYDDIDNFVNPDLLQKVRNMVPNYIQKFMNKNFEKHIEINKKRYNVDFSNYAIAGQSAKHIIDYFDFGSYILNDEEGNQIKNIPYYVDEYTYSFNGILISRHKFIDMLHLYIECLNEIEMELCNPNILPDEIKELNEAKEFILSKDNLGVILLNSLVHSSNCSHYALLKIIKEVFVKGPFNISLEESFNDILYGDRKGSI